MNELEKQLEELTLELIHTQMELSEVKEKYDSLVGKIRKDANDKRNIDDGNKFLLTNYGTQSGFWE